MAHNPVQIVLNTSAFILQPEPTPGGRNRDFFAGNDHDFSTHKKKLIRQISSIKSILMKSSQTNYIKAQLREEALAKGHRPTRKLFEGSSSPQVGAGSLGELYFEVTQQSLDLIEQKVMKAEEETTWKKDKQTQKMVASPSRLRSEVGALENITLPDPAEKRRFDVTQAITWLSDARTGGAYFVELFYLPHNQAEYSALFSSKQALINSLFAALDALPIGLFVKTYLPPSKRGQPLLTIKVCEGEMKVGLDAIKGTIHKTHRDLPRLDFSKEAHGALLKILQEHPLVKRINLPPIILESDFKHESIGKPVKLPTKQSGTRYPKVGIIDGGISNILAEWKIGTIDILADEHKSLDHGTFIGGLLVGTKNCGNSNEVAKEQDGCELCDISVFPDDDIAKVFEQYYPGGVLSFFEELENVVSVAKSQHGIHIFNMSLNLIDAVAEDDYSLWASLLDEIADKHKVTFVLSAGNLSGLHRPLLANEPDKILSVVASFRHNDTILQPAECVSALSVGALNPPNTEPHQMGNPACYTRRGPGLRVGVKPDLAHYGGSTLTEKNGHHGLFSVDPSGKLISGMGTSYAAPLVTKTLASLEAQIEGDVNQNTLIGFLIHHATLPAVLNHPSLAEIARQFVGFGIPSSSQEMLLTEDNSITLLFEGVIKDKQELIFNFSWPESLVDKQSGKCRGYAWMTLVYRPPLNRAYGAEFVRINLDAHLQQYEEKKKAWKGRLAQAYLPGTSGSPKFESELIRHGLKWWPIKHYRKKSVLGIGSSSQWRLHIEPLARDGERIPISGVPFTILLTVSDIKEKKPIFNELRQWLLAQNIVLADVRTSQRVRARRQ